MKILPIGLNSEASSSVSSNGDAQRFGQIADIEDTFTLSDDMTLRRNPNLSQIIEAEIKRHELIY